MRHPSRSLSGLLSRAVACLAAGAMGALVNSVAVWLGGVSGFNAFVSFKMAPALTWAWLCPRLLYGGLWGLLFLPPLLPRRPWAKALLLSLAPTAYMLLKVFPDMNAGLFGLARGPGAPWMVLVYNAIWALSAAAFLQASLLERTGAPPPPPRQGG